MANYFHLFKRLVDDVEIPVDTSHEEDIPRLFGDVPFLPEYGIDLIEENCLKIYENII